MAGDDDMAKKKQPLYMRVLKFFGTAVAAILCFIVFMLGYLQFVEEKQDFYPDQAKGISYSKLEKVVPGEGLPKELRINRSNNNLDVIKYGDRYYLSFRSAPSHFASTETILYVVSSSDLKRWRSEGKWEMGADLRECRFLVFRDKLFLYFFKGGTNPVKFEPQSMYVTEFLGDRKWTEPKTIYKPGYVIWRAKEHEGKAYMSVYFGSGLYTNQSEPSHLQMLESDDGYNYRLVDDTDIMTDYSAEEGEFEFDSEGNLYSTVRFEMFGGKVCRADKEHIIKWKCEFTNYKYDSSLMFRHGDEFYVVARRNVAGPFNRESKLLPASLRSKWYLVRYSLTRKRTALYRVNKEKLLLEPLFDFEGTRGDTAYAGVVQVAPNKYAVFNYSTDIDGFDWNWIGGQIVGSNIYSTIVEFKDK